MMRINLRTFVKILAAQLAALIAAHALAGDGTGPVRIPGDGTLPTLVGKGRGT